MDLTTHQSPTHHSASGLEVIAWNYLPAGPRDQGGQDLDAHAGLQKVHRAIGEHGVSAARMKAVDLTVVSAVYRTWSWTCLPIERRTLNDEGIIVSAPATANDG